MIFKFSTNFLLPYARKPAKYGGCGSTGLDATPTVQIHTGRPVEENLILTNVLIRGESNFDYKYVEKSVRVVRGSSFRNDLLQNPYFNNKFSVF